MKSAIVSAVVALSQAIGSTTVVEGVETRAELEQIEGLGCDVAQGFYFSRPLPGNAFEDFLRAGRHPAPDSDFLHAPSSRVRSSRPRLIGSAPAVATGLPPSVNKRWSWRRRTRDSAVK